MRECKNATSGNKGGEMKGREKREKEKKKIEDPMGKAMEDKVNKKIN